MEESQNISPLENLLIHYQQVSLSSHEYKGVDIESGSKGSRPISSLKLTGFHSPPPCVNRKDEVVTSIPMNANLDSLIFDFFVSSQGPISLIST